MNRAPVSVVKVGGSLLTSPDFPQRMRSWLADERRVKPERHLVLVVGGGKWVDAIRQLDEHAPLGDERAHWLCISLMDVTAALVAAMLPEVAPVSSFEELTRRVAVPGITIFKPQEFLSHIEPTCAGAKLPANWSVTSDSIAARLAIVLRAEELTVLKSARAPLPASTNNWLRRLSAAGYIDACFPSLERELPPFAFVSFPALER